MSTRTYKRRIKVIDKPFQFRMVATFLTVVLAGFILFSAGVFGYYWIRFAAGDNMFSEIITLHKQVTETRVVEENGAQKTETYTTTRDIPGVNRLELVLPPLLINDLLIMIFVIVVGIYSSHRIAGPAYRIRKDIDRVLGGEKGVRVRLRKNDALPEIADKVNQLIERIESSGDRKE